MKSAGLSLSQTYILDKRLRRNDRQSGKKMSFWDNIIRFHEVDRDKCPNGEKTSRAVRFLIDILRTRYKDRVPMDHPLWNRLRYISKPNCMWLEQCARKILTGSRLPGFSYVLRRLAEPREYLSAWMELEAALRFYLDGFKVSFIESSSISSPDLIVSNQDCKFYVEVSSLNPPDEENILYRLSDQILFNSEKVVMGGLISRVPVGDELENIIASINSAVLSAITDHKMIKFVEPGYATIYVAPLNLASQVPEDCRMQLSSVGLYPREPEQQIDLKVREKMKQLPLDEPSLLFLNSNLWSNDVVLHLFEKSHNTAVLIATFPQLMGLVLTAPNRGVDKPTPISRYYDDEKFFSISEISVSEFQSSLIWKNKHADKELPESIIHAIKEYHNKLVDLVPLDDDNHKKPSIQN